MAIVFVSVKKRQRIFLWAISLLVVFVLALMATSLLLPEFTDNKAIVVQKVFNAPDVKINFEAIDSPQVKNLEPFIPGAPDSGLGNSRPFSSN